MNNRLRGALIGLAVGDALGAAVEFRSPGSFAPVTGYRSGGPHGLKAGAVVPAQRIAQTDDEHSTVVTRHRADPRSTVSSRKWVEHEMQGS